LRRRSTVRNFCEYAAARFALATLAYTPRPVANALSRCYTSLFDLLLPRLRRVAMRNLDLAGMPTACADEVYRSLARMLVSFARFPRIRRQNISDWIRYEGFEHFEQALSRGKGVLFATGHLGNWELSAYAHAFMAAPMHVVVRPLDNPMLDELVERYRGLSGNTILSKRDFVRPMLKALARNEAVGILVDQNAGLDEGVFVDFFGRKACVSPSFAKLAARTGAAVIPGFAVWNEAEGRYVLKFYPPVEISGDAVADTQRIQSALERAIREHPGEWLWLHRRWKTRPVGEKDIY
jgi:Kdo2-lipid IVA lauroyltransferase/acyltransferase